MMETLPYFLVIGMIIGLSVLVFGLNAVLNVDDARDQTLVNSEIDQINNKMSLLSDMSVGSFDSLDIVIPKGKLVVSSDGTIKYNDRTFHLKFKPRCIKSESDKCENNLVLYPGKYHLLLYHGDNFGAKYCICFT